MSMNLKTLAVPAVAAHTASLIFLHGLGDTGAGWLPMIKSIAAAHPHVKFILPTARSRSITLNYGMSMPAWYDIVSLTSLEARQDAAGIKESVRCIHALISSEVIAGIPPSRIVLAGFSQGAAISLCAGLTYAPRLGGIGALSGYLPLAKELRAQLAGTRDFPLVFMAHGDEDNIVRPSWGRESFEALESIGIDVEFKIYKGMGHDSCEQEIAAFQDFLNKAVPRNEMDQSVKADL